MKIDHSIKPDRKGRFWDIESWQEQYKRKTVSAKEAAAQVNNGDYVFTCGGLNYPPAFMDELVNRVVMNNYHIDLYCTYSIYPDAPHMKPEVKNNIDIYTMFLGLEKKLWDQGNMQYCPCWMSHVGRLIHGHKARVGAFVVSPPNEDGWMARSIWAHHYAKEAYLNEHCEVVVVEVNENMPFIMSGSSQEEHSYIHVSEVDYIIENNYPLREIKGAPATKEEEIIAQYCAELVPDGGCLQIGLGGTADAVAANLVHSGKKDLGVYSEILTNGTYDLIEAGVLTNAAKNWKKGKSVVATVVGDKRLWDYAHNNPAVELLDGKFINDIRNIARNDRVTSINNAMEIDLQGQANSEAVGVRQFSGTGGQLEFVIAAQFSKGGKSILALNSTYTDKQGNLASKIKPFFDPGTPITVPRTIIEYVITEHGVVRLTNLSLRDRAKAMISIAHPQFRDELTFAAKKMELLR